MRQIGFGIIGAGMIAELHAKAMQDLDNVRLIGFFDTNAEAARRRAEEFHCRAYTDFEEFLADTAIEAVTVGTPSGMHADVVIPAARAGKHILCEKPLEITLEKVDAMIRCCAENRVLLVPVFQTRFARPVQLVREAMLAGRFGRMILASAQMRWYRTPEYYSGSSWRGTWAVDGGGVLMNQASHTVDQLLYINGDPEEVFGFSGTLTHEIEVEDNLCAAIRYRNGSFGTLEVSTSCAPGFPRRLEFSGSDGSVTFEEDKITRWEFTKPLPQDEEIRREFSGEADPCGGRSPMNISSAGHAKQLSDLANAILESRRPIMEGSEGRRAVELICGIYESIRTGKPVSFRK